MRLIGVSSIIAIVSANCALIDLKSGSNLFILGKYIVQIARFDPAKGVPTVIDSYAEFRKRAEAAGIKDIPQLVM
jgi:hypothetical protein